MNDRDTFASAAFPCCHEEIYREGQLKGYAADWREQIVRQAYAYADAMIRERGVTEPMPNEKRAEVSFTLTDAEREAVMRATDGYIAWMEDNVQLEEPMVQATLATLRGLLERTK